MKTKQEQKEDAEKEYWAIVTTVLEAFEVRIKEIDEQVKPLQVEQRIKSMSKLLKAWTVAGSHPEYHFKKIAELKETWPQLYEGIVEALQYQELKEASIAEAKNEERERMVEELFEIEKTKGKDAKHCTCLGYAIIQVVGGEDSKEGKEMIKRFSSLDNPK